jgi:hypothetical protein
MQQSGPDSPRAELNRIEEKSEARFRAWRTAYYRWITGELKTDRVLNVAHEDMEAAVIEAGNAYINLRKGTE